jgi:hypothetical protein
MATKNKPYESKGNLKYQILDHYGTILFWGFLLAFDLINSLTARGIFLVLSLITLIVLRKTKSKRQSLNADERAKFITNLSMKYSFAVLWAVLIVLLLTNMYQIINLTAKAVIITLIIVAALTLPTIRLVLERKY